MYQLNFPHFFISAILFVLFGVISTLVITPYAFVSFIGPSAAFVSALLIIWGGSTLIAVIISSPILALVLNYYFNFDANFAVMTIAILAILLQSVWANQLVSDLIRHNDWLTSRKTLLIFLVRIGPVASLVSASSVLVISILDNQVIQGTFFYTFINTWSASMLVAVFVTPVLIMAKNSQQFTLTKRVFVSVTSALGGLAIFLLFKTSQFEQQQYSNALFNQSTLEVKRLILDEINNVVSKTKSLSAFLKASDPVTSHEFFLFSESIFEQESSIVAFEWAPIVKAAERQNFELQATNILQNNYQINERLPNGEIVIAQERASYAPLYFIYPQLGNEGALGIDVFSFPKYKISMHKVVEGEEVVASAPIILSQGEYLQPATVFTKAVFSSLPKQDVALTETILSSATPVAQQKLSLISKGQLMGFVVVVARFEPFFESLSQKKSSEVSFFIQDITANQPETLYGQALPEGNRHSDSFTISVFSRTWQINIAEPSPWFSQPKNWQTWAVLLGGSFGSLLFQMLILMMAAYSSELSQQVSSKTRALVLAKESSEQKNLAKSHFLQTLNTELRVPLFAIKSCVEKLKDKGVNNKEVAGIAHAGNNVALLLDTMMDLSNIESGKINAKSVCFDFYGFLHRTESVLKASNAYKGKTIFFLIDDSVPHYLNSDEIYIQKLLSALIESAHHALKSNALRLTVKSHEHTSNEASIFFTLSSQNPVVNDLAKELLIQQEKESITIDSTAFSMAVKYSQLLGGDTTFGVLSSGAGMLNSSIRIVISSVEQQEAQQGLTFDLLP